jgi:hypothetical protein
MSFAYGCHRDPCGRRIALYWSSCLGLGTEGVTGHGSRVTGNRVTRQAFLLAFCLVLFGNARHDIASRSDASRRMSVGASSDTEPVIVDVAGTVRLRVLTTEASDALAIMASQDSARRIKLWRELVATEEYQRFTQRDSVFHRTRSEASFYAWLTADSVIARAPVLRHTFTEWSRADIAGAGRLSAAYLPSGTPVHASLYFVIKPQHNTFVYDLDEDPAIFVSIDPTINRAQFENEVAHELHHIGYAAACRAADTANTVTAMDTVARWMSSFGEGWAMLAAAGGPNVNPHWESDSADRARWDADYAHVGDGMEQLSELFAAVLDRRLPGPDSIQARAMGFFGIQGPWYTVGYLMVRTVEVTYGRPRLLSMLCDPVKLVLTYEEAARAANARSETKLPLWPHTLIKALRAYEMRTRE